MKTNKKNLILYIVSQTISKIGSSVLDFAIIWSMVLYNESSNPFVISIIITYIPKVLVAYFLEKIKVNKNHKIMMNIGDIITAFFSMALLFVDFEKLHLVYFIIFMRSIGVGIMEPYSNSIVVMLFDKEYYYKKVNALNSFIKSIISLIIPIITALILSYFSIKYIALLDVLTAIVSLFMVSNLKLLNKEEIKNKIEKIKLNILGQKMLFINSMFYFFMTIPGFMTALLVKYYFGENIDYLKYNEIFWTIGMIIGSYIVIKIKLDNKTQFSYSIMAFGTTIFILSLSNDISIYLIVILFSGITFPFYTTTNNLIIQKNMSKLENEYYFLKESMYINIAIPLSMIIFGYILNYMSINILFLLSGLFIVLLGLLILTLILKNEKIKI